MRLLLGFLLTLSGLPTALACSCGASSPFLELAHRADLVVLGTVVSHEGHGMDFRIESVYRGNESRDVIRAWGDDGASCRPYTSRFATGSRWVLILQGTSGGIDGESAGEDYAVQGCGEGYLAVSGDSVYLSDRQERWQLTRLASEVALLDRMPPPLTALELERRRLEAAIRSGGSVAPAAPTAASQAAFDCRSIMNEPIDGTGIGTVEPIAAGGFDPPAGASEALARAYRQLPAICRVEGHFFPSRDAALPFELWIPLYSWNSQSEGVVIPQEVPRRDLISAVGDRPLARGSAVFGLMLPASAADAVDFLTRFRRVIDRMRPVAIRRTRTFLGNTGIYAQTGSSSSAIVPQGPGRVEGRVNLQGQPVADLKLRLVMNRSQWTPWLSTDRNGRYSFDLPYGEYSIDGYVIDSMSADRGLAGAINHPLLTYRMESVTVDDTGPARGVDLSYVYPIRVQWPVGSVTVDQSRQVVWNPYPGAAYYSLYVNRRGGGRTVEGLRNYWSADNIAGTSAELPANQLLLAPGTYDLRITAFDAGGTQISTTPSYRGVEFQIVE